MLRTTPLHDWHGANSAKMAEFAGWSMPIQYGTGSIQEHHLVRRSAGLFDVSHMGQVSVRGADAASYLESLVTSNVGSLHENQSTYGILCLPSGGVIDDIFVYRLPDQWLVVVNASNVAKDVAWMESHLPSAGVELADVSDDYAMFALQGPHAIGIMDAVCEGKKPSSVSRFDAASVSISGISCTIGRTGYTGEDGVEIFAPTGSARAIWETILAAAARLNVECGPIGLAARDSLRFEPGFPLYGHELTEEISPIQARLKWACDLDKEFIGAQAIRDQASRGVTTRLATVQLTEPGVPREGFPVISGGKVVGRVASGMYAPTIDAYCANVYLPTALATVGTKLDIVIRGKARPAVVVKRPLYKPAYR